MKRIKGMRRVLVMRKSGIAGQDQIFIQWLVNVSFADIAAFQTCENIDRFVRTAVIDRYDIIEP